MGKGLTEIRCKIKKTPILLSWDFVKTESSRKQEWEKVPAGCKGGGHCNARLRARGKGMKGTPQHCTKWQWTNTGGGRSGRQGK